MANLVAAATAAQGRKRKCPQCGHKQVVSVFLATQPVACHRCAATIAPLAAKSQQPAPTGKTRGSGK